MTKVSISIIICTYNRSRLLKKCLESLLHQLIEEIEIIVIDNNSTDETVEVIKEYTTIYRNIRYVFEKRIGLSYARNRGIQESKADWILYIDDDALAFTDLVERAEYLVERGDYDCVGGMYYSYYEGEKPKWIPEGFGTKQLYAKDLTDCPFTIPCGGIVLYRKSMLIHLGGFKPDYGMNGSEKKLGEETELQFRAEKSGYSIGFDPTLKIHHLVKPEYTTLLWFLKRAFLEGKTIMLIEKNMTFITIFGLFLRSLGGLLLFRLPKNMYKLVRKRDYYWQNFIHDSLRPNLLFWGRMVGSFSM